MMHGAASRIFFVLLLLPLLAGGLTPFPHGFCFPPLPLGSARSHSFFFFFIPSPPPFSLFTCVRQGPPGDPTWRKARAAATTTIRKAMDAFGTSPPDADLEIASRDYVQRVRGLRNDAYRQAVGEIAGEMYGVVYAQAYRDALERHRREWGSPAP
ncbi:uncharacterized protein Tco025E_03966 [Trypanosoma conorhini]|uniref:Uncharacterized protein n=1 Tax=Trypanosoma conorhini TaxID=83891 RepID=A0A422PQ79_9TRYP|nr:uncharacterized protein Tco025E_03966 [Trypanosoma conorhini]RNF19899.1 hypothetical protein Tco025E_03966 [Trypanosoma conorhini]